MVNRATTVRENSGIILKINKKRKATRESSPMAFHHSFKEAAFV